MAKLKSTQVYGDLNVSGEARINGQLVWHSGNNPDMDDIAGLVSALNAKAANSTTNAALALKADKSTTNAALALKADKSTTNSLQTQLDLVRKLALAGL